MIAHLQFVVVGGWKNILRTVVRTPAYGTGQTPVPWVTICVLRIPDAFRLIQRGEW